MRSRLALARRGAGRCEFTYEILMYQPIKLRQPFTFFLSLTSIRKTACGKYPAYAGVYTHCSPNCPVNQLDALTNDKIDHAISPF